MQRLQQFYWLDVNVILSSSIIECSAQFFIDLTGSSVPGNGTHRWKVQKNSLTSENGATAEREYPRGEGDKGTTSGAFPAKQTSRTASHW
jgi:hypothetical protein